MKPRRSLRRSLTTSGDLRRRGQSLGDKLTNVAVKATKKAILKHQTAMDRGRRKTAHGRPFLHAELDVLKLKIRNAGGVRLSGWLIVQEVGKKKKKKKMGLLGLVKKKKKDADADKLFFVLRHDTNRFEAYMYADGVATINSPPMSDLDVLASVHHLSDSDVASIRDWNPLRFVIDIECIKSVTPLHDAEG